MAIVTQSPPAHNQQGDRPARSRPSPDSFCSVLRAKPSDVQGERQRVVIVVEDEPDISELLVTLLESDGYRSWPALNADMALRLARSKRPDVITMDLALPDHDGRYLLHKLKSSPRTRDIPVIVVSANPELLGPLERPLVAGFVNKPFEIRDLLRITRQAIVTRRHPPSSRPERPVATVTVAH